jgi:electron transfer flavoprotein alpha subunit
MSDLLALVPVRAGVLPAGGAETVAEAGGRALLVGDAASEAAELLAGIATELRVWDTPGYAPGEWARQLAPLVASEHLIVLPASPDGRDLAPRLAAELERPLFAGAMELRDHTVTTVRHGGRVLVDHTVSGPSVVTLQPGVRGVSLHGDPVAADVVHVRPELDGPAAADAQLEELLPPDVSTMDLSEAPRILGGGAGLDGAERFVQLAEIAAVLDASMGATRVITDRGWIGHHRQIGTTGVVVDPQLYLAFGISGAVQHTAGLGHPEHIISVNVDPHCPMMELADLAVVSDANATLDELAARLATPVSGMGGTP